MPPEWFSWLWANRDEIVRLLTLIGGAIGIYFLAIRTRAADRTARAALDQAKIAADQAEIAAKRHAEQTKADRERRITESFAKAVEQLGSDKLETRLGAIYTLERISQEKGSEREYWPIMETLTAFVREHAPWPPRQALSNPFVQFQDSSAGAAGENMPAEKPESGEQASVQIRTRLIEARLRCGGPTTDIQAILTVLGRRDESARQRDEKAKRRVGLAATDLRGAHLEGAHLERADLEGAHLEYANLEGAHLEAAWLWEAHLEAAVLTGAHLEYAHLKGAHLEYADIQGAHLERASLQGAHLEDARLYEAYLERASLQVAHLERASLRGAHLEDAFGLTQEQLASASGDDRTTLPAGLTRPPHWSDNSE